MRGIEKSFDELIRQVDEIRVELIRLRRIIREEREAAADKTPVRPPSLSAFQAFEASADFLKKKG